MQLAKLKKPIEPNFCIPHIESILCPIDFSEFSIYAYEYAQSLAHHYGAILSLEYVLYSPKPVEFWNVYPDAYEDSCRKDRDKAERQLKDFAARYARIETRSQCFVQEAPLDGSVTDLIISLAKRQAADLIVLGTRGLRGFDRFVMGTITEKVLRRARCPVLAVRRPAHHIVRSVRDPELIHLKRMLLCVDLSDLSNHVSRYAFSLALEHGAQLTLLHVVNGTSKSGDLQSTTEKVAKRMEQYIDPGARDVCSVKVKVRFGKPYLEITQLALEEKTDLVIMGERSRGSLHRAFFGSTTYRVIQLGLAPVLAVHVRVA